MGFPTFHGFSGGVFLLLLLNTALFLAFLKEVCKKLLGFGGVRMNPQGGVGPGMGVGEMITILPVVPFDPKKGGASAGGGGCAVCLQDVCGGEEVRDLPLCRHVFHRACLDKWMIEYRQMTCPLCRRSLAPPDEDEENRIFKYKRWEQDVADDLLLWFSSFHGSSLHGSFWW